MSEPTNRFYKFGPFSIDGQKRVLLRDGEVVPLAPKAFDVLLVLVQHHGEVLEKGELMDLLWPDSDVEESNLPQHISALRKALGESPNERKYIVTVPGKGYKFAADVKRANDDTPEVVVARYTKSTLVIEDREHGQEIEQKPERLPHASVSFTRRRKFLYTAVAIAILAVVAAGLFYLFSWTTKGPASPSMKVVPFTSFPGREDHAAFSPDGNQIAFVWGGEKDDNPDIYVKSVGGQSPLRLTSDPASEFSPAWSPDGQSIAFVRVSESGYAIFTVSALGSGPERKLLSLAHKADWRRPLGIDWSPDGKFIAFPNKDPKQESVGIFLFSPETGEKRTLTSPPAQYWGDYCPAFSPDNQTLAFIRMNTPGTSDIYLAPVAGGEPRRLTFDNAALFHRVTWSPDGREIVFTSNRAGTYSLWKVPVSGGAPERLAVGGDNAFSPSISRKGQRLAYLAYLQSFRDQNIYRLEVPGPTGQRNSPIKLIASTRDDSAPQISPDGKRIAFYSERSGSSEIWVCDSEGQNPIQLTSFGGPHTGTPRWSPDGQQIAFDSQATGNFDIYVVSVGGGLPRRLTTESSNDVVPSWSRDGRWVYFASNRGTEQLVWKVSQLWKVPAEGGEAVQVTKSGGFAAFESPDSQFVIYNKSFTAPAIWRVAVDGGEETPVLDSLKAWGHWAIVNDGIYFINPDAEGGVAIEFFSFATHRATQIARLGKVNIGHGFAVSPDRQWILYTVMDHGGSDIMLVENFR